MRRCEQVDNIKCDSSNFADVISASLEQFSDEKTKEIKKILTDKSKELAENIKRDSPRRAKNGGKYAKGWVAEKDYENNLNIQYTIHNKTDYQLTHLLENGHATRNGGRVEGIPHIAPNTEAIEKEIDDEIQKTAGD